MTRVLSAISYAILIFGFMYVFWQLGRSFENGSLAEKLTVPGHQYRALISTDSEGK